MEKFNVRKHIPQKEPFVMVDELISVSGDKIESTFEVRPDNIFMEGNQLREYALIENLAQSTAAGLIYKHRKSRKKINDGFIGAITDLKLFGLPETGDTIDTEVVVTANFENMFMIHGKCRVGDKVLLECDMKLAGRK